MAERHQSTTSAEWARGDGRKADSAMHLNPASSVRWRRIRQVALAAMADALITVVAYMAALYARAFLAPSAFILGLGFTIFAAMLMLVSLYAFGVYHRIWSQTSGHGIIIIIYAVAAATGMVTLVDLLITPRPLPLSVIAVGSALALSGFIAVRYRSRLLSGLLWRWRAVWHREFPPMSTRVLIVGAGESGQAIARRLKHHAPTGESYKIVGFIDDDPTKHNMYVENAPVLGGHDDLPLIVESKRVDLIVMAIHNIDGPKFRHILSLCEGTNARIKVVPDMFALLNAQNGAPLLREIQPEDFLGRKPVDRHEGVDLSPVTGKLVLVTGAAGSIGAELCRQLLTFDPTALIMLDNNESGLHDMVTELRARHPDTIVWPVLADIAERDTIAKVFRDHKPQVVFHAAAYKHVPMLEYYPDQAVRVNIGGTWNVAEAARDCGAERFVLISTDKAVNPSSVMGASKRACERVIMALAQQNGHRTLFTAVRFGNVLGSRGSVVPTFNRQIENGGPVTVTDPEMTRYFMSTSEAVNLVIHAACLTTGGDLFMLNMGEVVHILEMAERMIRMRGLRPYKDIPIKFIGVRPGEKLFEELRSTTEQEVPTAHPNILRLVDGENDLKPSAYLEQVSQLCRADLSQSADVQRDIFALACPGSAARVRRNGAFGVAAD
ncbi:MAG: polysaccharide biosynthesis protein [Anaerolineae bacterium]|nr:polysaccharide biosynthesis protein [Anaerolineae bacterium]